VARRSSGKFWSAAGYRSPEVFWSLAEYQLAWVSGLPEGYLSASVFGRRPASVLRQREVRVVGAPHRLGTLHLGRVESDEVSHRRDQRGANDQCD
jgi:hypothetical protein